MFKNYFTITLRQLAKSKSFTFINLSGLTLGFLCFILLALYLHDELSFDSFHPDADRMVRIMQHEQQEDGTIRTTNQVSPLLGKEADTQFEEVESSCRLTAFGRVTLGNDPASRGYERIWTVSDNYFEFFNFKLVEGDPATVLKNPDAIVISQSLAKKYFGTEPAVGKQIWSAFRREGQPVHLTVSGIMQDPPTNSHIQLHIVFAEATWPSVFRWYNEYVTTNWTSNEYVTYLKLKPGSTTTTLADKIGTLVKSHYPADQVYKSSFSLMPLSEVHFTLDNAQDNELNANSIKPFYLYMFAAVGALLLIIACLNYMNLSTAAAIKRTREIGTRKTLGAQRMQLVMQFVTDALVMSAFSLILALAFAQILLPFVNDFTGKTLTLVALPLPWMLTIAGLILLVGLLSALYPAFVSAGVSTAQALKKEIRIGNQSLPVRKLLLTAQFTISIIMIASTLVIYRQLQFMRSKDIGIDVEGQLVIDINSNNLRGNFESIKAEFSKPAEVLSITTSTRVPGEWKSFPISAVAIPGLEQAREFIFVGIDKDFLKTYNIKLLQGRTIDDPIADSLKVVLTEAAVKQLGLTSPLGQMLEIPRIRFGGSTEILEGGFNVEVIGVVEDFHFESLRKEMMPVIFGAPNTTIQRIDYYTLKIKTANWPETLEKLKAINVQLDPDNPLEYTFLDSRFKEFYAADAKRGQIFLAFSLVIVLIACTGLYALVSYSVESRNKEIGVRKVLGASVQSILGLVSKEFLILIGIACVMAIPVAYFFMAEWLKDFAYRIQLGAGSFALAGLVAVFIALCTIGVRTIKAATENPVKSLRSE